MVHIWNVAGSDGLAYRVLETHDVLAPENDLLLKVGELQPGSRNLVVVDSAVADLYGAQISAYFAYHGVQAQVMRIEATEERKSIETLFSIIDALKCIRPKRYSEPIIAIGGGVVTDVVGSAAHLYRRGTPHIRVPTTLMGLIDAGIGVKVGVNYKGHKNLLGSYNPPIAALLDRSFLATLPERQIRNGLAEMVKIAVIRDRRLFALLEERIGEFVAARFATPFGEVAVSRAVEAMLAELRPNLRERELRRPVDLGHTFSPRIELDSAGELLHGEAVSIDIALCCALAVLRGILERGDAARILALLKTAQLPVAHSLCSIDRLGTALQESTLHRDGHQHIPLPTAIGETAFAEDITLDEIKIAKDLLMDLLDETP